MKTKMPSLNAGSMADIAFLLLVFFLLVTTISSDKGILKILPSQDGEAARIPDQNVLEIQLNEAGNYLVEGSPMKEDSIRHILRLFYTNGGVWSEEIPLVNFPVRRALDEDRLRGETDNDTAFALQTFGSFRRMPGSAVIMFTFDEHVSYNDYVHTLDMVDGVVNGLRDELCLRKLGISYRQLQPSIPEQLALIRAAQQVFPQCLAEQELQP
ncbi:MAG: biopolymer transporter ExbD [Flavobacteriales bacterium]|nr:biopolymer transporter ExbD [Flavobacteriales bacterium]